MGEMKKRETYTAKVYTPRYIYHFQIGISQTALKKKLVLRNGIKVLHNGDPINSR